MRVHTGSGIGTSGNMTILMRREPGSGSPLTDVGGAWMPARLIYFMIKNVQKCFNYRQNDFTNSIIVSFDKQRHLQHYIFELTVRILGWQESGVLGVGNTPVGVPEIVTGSINGPVFVVGAWANRWLTSGTLWGCGYLTETIKVSVRA